jgi:ABC-type polysaccharide/polyol phosphate export permease
VSGRPLRQQLELISSLAKRDLKVRYKDSVLGFLWSLFRPAFLTLVLWAVFAHILVVPFSIRGIPYWLHVLVSVLSWNFMVGSLFDASGSILSNANLIKKVRLDAEVFPVACIVANAVHFMLALMLVVVVLVLGGYGLHWEILLLPAVLGVQVLLVLGLAFYVSSLNVFYRDVGSMLELGTLAWFYVTPIIYPLNFAREQLLARLGEVGFMIYMLNPAAAIVAGIRRFLLYGDARAEVSDPQLGVYLVISFVVSLVIAVTGWLVFRRLSERFADEL